MSCEKARFSLWKIYGNRMRAELVSFVSLAVPQGNTSPMSAVGHRAGLFELALHCLEKLRIRLRILQLVQQEFDGSKFIHRMQDFAKYPQFLQFIGFS